MPAGLAATLARAENRPYPLPMNGSGQPCPMCGSDDVAGVLLSDKEEPWPFTIAFPTPESPAFGCCSCGHMYGNWIEQYAD